MLKGINITKIYNKGKDNEVVALDGACIEIEDASTLALMGVSGSGKSTMLHILGCLDVLSEGEYLIDGVAANKMNTTELAHLRNAKFGFVLQENALLVKDSVFENVRLPLTFSNKYKVKEHKTRVLDILNMLGIKALAKRKINTLSGGQKQRVAIARAMVNDPDIILADEPTSALDSTTASEIMEVLLGLNKLGKTIIVVTHDISVAKKMSRIVNIVDGKIV